MRIAVVAPNTSKLKLATEKEAKLDCVEHILNNVWPLDASELPFAHTDYFALLGGTAFPLRFPRQVLQQALTLEVHEESKQELVHFHN